MKKFIVAIVLISMVCMNCMAEVKVSTTWFGHVLEQTTVKFTDDTGYVKINVDDTGEIITMVPFEGTFVIITHSGDRIDLIDYGISENYTDFRAMTDLNLAIDVIHMRDMMGR